VNRTEEDRRPAVKCLPGFYLTLLAYSVEAGCDGEVEAR
jgi:hypothetical protein